MPFTFSHPAIIIPFLKNRQFFSASGLIMGSLAPDFEYFIRMKVVANYGHSVFGVIWYDLPLSLIILFMFHAFVRNDIIRNSPNCITSRFTQYVKFNWIEHFQKNWLTVILSILLGAYTHIIWDNFTHAGGFFVQLFPILRKEIEIMIVTVPIYNILQHLSSLIGGVLILIFIYKLPRIQIEHIKPNKIAYKLLILLFTITILFLRFQDGINLNFYGDIVASIIAAILLSILMTSLILNWFKRIF